MRKKHFKSKSFFLIILISLFLSGNLRGKLFQEQVDQDVREGRITETEALYYRAVQMLCPDRLPNVYRSYAHESEKCGLRLNYNIRENWKLFNTEQQQLLRPLLYRPDPSELPIHYLSPEGRFRIHYTTVGTDAVSLEDLDGSGVPDYIEEVGRTMDHVYHTEIEEMGFPAPPEDFDIDGPEWDVYIRNISDYGYTTWEYPVSQNPDVWTTYITLDNDYSQTKTKGLDGLHVSAAHEFFHMIQFGYNFRYEDIFVMEAASTWMEDAVYDSVNDYLYYLPSYFRNTNIPFNHSGSNREYGLSIWFHFLEKRFGGYEIVKEVWEQIVSYPAMGALDQALQDRGSSFPAELTLFYGWNYMTGSRSDSVRFYPEGDTYPEINLDGSYPFSSDTTMTVEVNPTASRYYQFVREDSVQVTLILTNVDWHFRSDENHVRLVLVQGERHAFLKDLQYGMYAGVSSEDHSEWGGVAVSESSDQSPYFVTFDLYSSNLNEKNLPPTFPNPFITGQHAAVQIPFMLDEPDLIHVFICNSSGYEVFSDEKYYNAEGLQYYQWLGKDKNGQVVPSGIYLYVLSVNDVVIRREAFAVIR
jgi:hypothetical protein